MNPTLNTLRNLRSIHGDFSDRPIPNEKLETILETAIRAANASNRQSYSIVVVDDAKRQEQLTGYKGSVTLIFCVDFNRLIDTATLLGHEYSLQGVTPFLTGSIDTALAAQTAAIAAKSLGIDSLFTNGIHRGDFARVFDLLKLPEKYCFPLIALVLGYANKEPAHLRGRLTGPCIVHRCEYHVANEDELSAIIQQYDDSDANLGLSVPWKENGFDHFLDWFFEVWTNRAPMGEGRSQLFEWLIKTGFLSGDVD